MTARMDAGTSFGLVVLQTELERFKFLVRSFLRARIAKVGQCLSTNSTHISPFDQQNPAAGTMKPNQTKPNA